MSLWLNDRFSTARTFALVLVFTVLATLIGIAPSQAVSIEQGSVPTANPVDFTPRVIDGEVRAITQVGNRVFVGGTFTQVRQVTGNVLFTRNSIFAYDRTTGLIDTGFVPALTGAVDALGAAPGGTAVFAGGNFSTVNGVNNYGITKLNVSDGTRVIGFNATTAGRVRDLKVHGNKVYLGGDLWAINGVSRPRLGAINATTGAIDTTLNVGPTLPRINSMWVQKLDVSPDGTKLAIIGNFLAVGGADRKQIALIDLTTSPATVANWSTEGYSAACASVFWTYMRDIEFSPDSSYFAVVTTGGPNGMTLCDTTARFNPNATGTGIVQEWANWTGGDTLWSVAVTDVAIYVGGHQRWLNNHTGRDSAGPGAVSREGIGALDPVNGVPLTWNPGKDRGVGVFDIYLTTDGVYIGSDTDNVAGEWHPKFAMFPLTGGTVPPAPTPISLPADLYWGSSTANTLSKAAYDGSAFGPTTTVSHPLTWSAVRSAFWEAGKLYYVTGASMFSRTWDGTTFGPEVNLNTWPNWTTTTAMDWDGGKLYYTDGSTNLYYRYFSLESGIVGSQTFTVSTSTDNASWSTTAGIFVAGNHLYQARTSGQLWRWDLVNADIVAGTGVMVASTGWNVQDLFLADFDDEPDLPPTVDLTAPAAGATVSGNAVTVSATATDDDELDHVEFFTNGASIGVDTDGSDGWSVAWDSTGTADGPTSLTAAATDSADQTTISAGRTVTVDNVGPAVSITAPTGGATVSGTAVTVSANATDTVGLSKVEFFANGTSIGVDTNGADGWAATWDTTSVANGTVDLTAVATDTGGRTATSAAVPVTVDNGPPPSSDRVIVISIDGFNPEALGQTATPSLDRMVDEGVSTENARTAFESTQTLPNHLSMVTGVPVTETGGHGVTFNEDNGSTVHVTAGHYVTSMFDVAHDNGMSTVLYAGKPKFDFVDRSWDGTNGAVDATGPDNGRDKIDVYARGDGTAMTTQLLTRLDTAPPNLAMIHYAATDGAAHESGFLSQEYLDSLTEIDGLIGQILDAVEADPALAETTVIVTTDHGGSGFEHGTPTSAVNYTIPMFVWGDGVSEGVDLYAINGATRSNPGTGRPGYSGGQPIRNADVANLALDLLELGAVTGSTINPAQDLAVEGVPPVNQPPTVSMSTPAAGARVSGASVNVAADATDTDGTVTEVEFFADGTSIGTDSDAGDGWSVAWDTMAVTDGPVDLTATATDDDSAVATSAARSVTVDNDADPGPVVMVVASPTALHASETLVRNRLQTMGFTVDVVDDTGVTAAAASGASFVLISFTVANSVGATFRDVTVPVWTAKTYLFDDMEMTGPTAGTHYENRSFSTMAIAATGHPMAAGRTGTVSYLTANTSQPWAVPVASATTVATNGGQAVAFVIPAGGTLDNGQAAAACRLTYPVFQQGPQRYTADGWAMFEATATYAAGGCS